MFRALLWNQSKETEIRCQTSRVMPTLNASAYGRLISGSGEAKFCGTLTRKLLGTVAKLISHPASLAKLHPGEPCAMLSLFLSVHGAVKNCTSAFAGS